MPLRLRQPASLDADRKSRSSSTGASVTLGERRRFAAPTQRKLILCRKAVMIAGYETLFRWQEPNRPAQFEAEHRGRHDHPRHVPLRATRSSASLHAQCWSTMNCRKKSASSPYASSGRTFATALVWTDDDHRSPFTVNAVQLKNSGPFLHAKARPSR